MKHKLIFVCVCVLTLLSSCKKDTESKVNTSTQTSSTNALSKSGLNDYAMITNAVSEANGMLVFKDQKAYDDVVTSLQALRDDDDYFNNCLTELGFSLEDPSDDDSEPAYPVFKVFENRFPNFSSLLFKIEQEEIDHLLAGGNIQEFEEHFWADPYLKALVNEDMEIQIGDWIIRQIDENRAVIISDADPVKLADVRNTEVENLENSTNVKICDLRNPDHRALLDINDGIPKNADCFAGFKWRQGSSLGGTDFWLFTEASFNTTTNMTFHWDFGGGTYNDGTQSLPTFTTTGPTPFPLNVSFPSNGYPYTVTLTLTLAATGCNSTHSVIIPNPGTCYGDFEIIDDPNDGTHHWFNVISTLGASPQYDWNFGDNNGLANGGPNVDHFYANSGTYNVDLSTSSGSCNWVETKTVSTGCGRTGWSGEDDDRYANNRRLIRGKLFLNNTFWHHGVGARTKNYKVLSNGNERIQKADVIEVAIGGQAHYKATNNSTCQTRNYGNWNHNFVSKNKRKVIDRVHIYNSTVWQVVNGYPARLFARDNAITSGHRGDDNGGISNTVTIDFGQ